MFNRKSVIIGISGTVAGLLMVVLAFSAGATQTTHGQQTTTPTTAATVTTPGATGTATATRTPSGALTPAASPTAGAELPTTGTGPSDGGMSTPLLWLAGGGVLLAIAGGALAVSGAYRRR